MNDSFHFLKDWFDLIEALPNEDQLKIYQAISRYAFEGKLPEDKYIIAITSLIFKTIERNRDKYNKTCEKRKEAIAKRWKDNKENKENANDTNVYKCIDKYSDVYKSIQEKEEKRKQEENEEQEKRAKKEKEVKEEKNKKEEKEIDVDEEKINKKEIEVDFLKRFVADEEFIQEYFSQFPYIERLSAETNRSPDELKGIAHDILAEWRANKQDVHRDYTDAARHLSAHIRIKNKNLPPPNKVKLLSPEYTQRQNEFKERWKQITQYNN